MVRKAIKNEEILKASTENEFTFPKYTTQLINLANQNAQGTRPRVVGQMSDLVQECPEKTLKGWKTWYLSKNPKALDNATEKIFDMIINLQEAMNYITKDLVRSWVEDLVINKTFVGMKFQGYLLKIISKEKSLNYRLANSEEEAKGIDGYIGNIPVSVKPTSYKTKNMLRETINVKMIYYEKTKTGLVVEYDF